MNNFILICVIEILLEKAVFSKKMAAGEFFVGQQKNNISCTKIFHAMQ
jgi:hypothetical protein